MLYGIIQIKISEPHLHSVCQNLSLDIKHLANSILDVAENASQKYDNLKYTQFIDVLKGFRIEDQIEFIEYILRLFRKSSFENDIQKFVILSLFNHQEIYGSGGNELLKPYFITLNKLKNYKNVQIINTIKLLSNEEKLNQDSFFCENKHFNLKGHKLISDIVYEELLIN